MGAGGTGSAEDIAGGNGGTLRGCVTFAQGKVGQAFSFDGIGGYVDLGSGASLNRPGSLTWSVWVKSPVLTHYSYFISDFGSPVPASQGSLAISPTNSGYSLWKGIGGNVLLAFSAK